MDVGTRSYIENVLQTKVKNSSADRNWRKLRTGMFVVRALGKEVTTDEICSEGNDTAHQLVVGELSRCIC